jgi:hypothetical protein
MARLRTKGDLPPMLLEYMRRALDKEDGGDYWDYFYDCLKLVILLVDIEILVQANRSTQDLEIIAGVISRVLLGIYERRCDDPIRECLEEIEGDPAQQAASLIANLRRLADGLERAAFDKRCSSNDESHGPGDTSTVAGQSTYKAKGGDMQAIDRRLRFLLWEAGKLLFNPSKYIIVRR